MFDVTTKIATMKDVAKEAGCHPSTVSLALRGDTRIPEATQKKIAMAATRLGYQTNPLVSAWVSARRAGRTAERHVPLAYLDSRSSAAGSSGEETYLAALKKAKDHGYSLNKFYVEDYAKNLSRLSKVLETRNVQGIILGPNLEGGSLEGIEWSIFAVVAIGYGLSAPKVHRVAEDHCSIMSQAFANCLSAGFRRVGLALSSEHNEMQLGHWLAIYLREQAKSLRASERLPIHFGRNGFEGSSARSWLKQNEPEVLLVDDLEAWKGCGVPCVDLMSASFLSAFNGQEKQRDVGRTAIDLLTTLVRSNARGLPSNRRTVLVESSPDAAPVSFASVEEVQALSA